MSGFWKWLGSKRGFVFATIVVMVILHGNDRQFWPKIPYLSLKNESVIEHVRLLFNSFALVSLGQVALGTLPRQRWLGRAAVTVGLPLTLPGLIWLGRSGLRLRPPISEVYNLSLVLILPVAAAAIEDGIATIN